MKKKADIYNYKRNLSRTLFNLSRSKIHEQNKATILEFHEHCLSNGLSLARTIKYITTFRMFAEMLNKPFEEAKKEDIIKLVQEMERRDYSDWTKHDYMAMLRIFFKWLRKANDYPEEVRWIRSRRRRKNVLPEELLTEEEVKRLAESATNPRDKALVLVLYESGCRPGEILTLRIKHVNFDEYGAVLIVDGKTGNRRVRIIASALALATWLDNHPHRNDSDAPLWVSIGVRNKGSVLKYNAVKSVLKELATKAKVRKRVYPYLFRHSRATRLANSLTDAQLKQHFGWVQDSRMASTYVHLSGRDVDAALLRLHGLAKEDNGKEDKFKVEICPRCKTKNSPTSKFCNTCGSPLSLKIAFQVDDIRRKADRVMTELVKRPEVLDVLLNALEKIKE